MNCLSASTPGHALVAALRAEAVMRQVSLRSLAAMLSPHPETWLRQLEAAVRPRRETIARVQALIEGKPIPAAPPNNFQARARRGEPARERLHVVERPLPAETLPPRVTRDPCPRCAVRADVGCPHYLGEGAWR